MRGRPRGARRRWAVALISAVLVTAAGSIGLAGTAGAGRPPPPKPDLSGTWLTQDKLPWRFTGDGNGGYTATYHGTGAHAQLVGTVTATFDGRTLTGTVHVEEPNQVEGGAATVTDGTATFAYAGVHPPELEGDLIVPAGTYHFLLTCQSAACNKRACSFVGRGQDAETKQEASLYDDIDVLLAARIPGSSCHVEISNGKGSGTLGSLNADQLKKLLADSKSSLAREFPDAPGKVRDKVARALFVASVLVAVNTPQDSQPAFPGVRNLVDSKLFAVVAGAALKPPGDDKAADAMRGLVRTLALDDAVSGAEEGQ